MILSKCIINTSEQYYSVTVLELYVSVIHVAGNSFLNMYQYPTNIQLSSEA